MKILFFSTAFPQPQDPCRSPYNLHRCEALSKDHEVVVVSPRSWRHKGPGGEPVRAKATFGGIHVSYPTFYYPSGILHGTHAWCMYQSVRSEVKAILRGFRPDAILSYWTYPDGAVALRLARQLDVPAVAFAGGSDVLLVQNGDAAGRRVRRVLEGVDAIATVSDDLKTKIAQLGVPAEKVVVLPPAVDTGTFSPGDRDAARRTLQIDADDRLLVWVGRMVDVKGLTHLLSACRLLSDRGVRYRLSLIGDGPLRQKLESQAAALGISERVLFPGRIAQGGLPDWYRAADAVVLPSLSEGTPNVLLEAQACGTPFVASSVGGIPPLSRPAVDELVPPADPGSLAAAIERVVSRPRPAVPAAALGWEETAARLTELFGSVIRQRKSTDGAVVLAPTL